MINEESKQKKSKKEQENISRLAFKGAFMDKLRHSRLPTGFKATKEYMQVRSGLCNFLGQPSYTDHIKNGVSFKWYLDIIKHYEIPKEFSKMKDDIGEYILFHMFLPRTCTVEIKFLPSIVPLMISPMRRSRPVGGDCVRVLVRREQ
jgi:hypothetical protein